MGYNIKGDYYTHTYSNASPFNKNKGDVTCQYCGVRLGKANIDMCEVLDKRFKKNDGLNKTRKTGRSMSASGKGWIKDKRKRD